MTIILLGLIMVLLGGCIVWMLIMRRQIVPLWLLILAISCLFGVGVAILAFIPSNSLVIAPAEPVNLVDRFSIDGEKAPELNGRLALVGVYEIEPNLLQSLLYRLDDRVTMTRKLPEDVGAARSNDEAAIKQSKKVAAAAAYRLLGEEVRITGGGALVTGVDPEGPAHGSLKSGDRIVRLDGAAVATAQDVTSAIAKLPPGSVVKIGFRRDGQPNVITVKTGEPNDNTPKAKSRIGIGISTWDLGIELPHEVKIDTDDILGPSAGLAFAIAIYDAESDDDLVHGRRVAATGQLTLEGMVESVGGAREKAIGAQEAGYELMLIPRDNLDRVKDGLRQACGGDIKSKDCIKVVPVDSVEDAIDYLENS